MLCDLGWDFLLMGLKSIWMVIRTIGFGDEGPQCKFESWRSWEHMY